MEPSSLTTSVRTNGKISHTSVSKKNHLRLSTGRLCDKTHSYISGTENDSEIIIIDGLSSQHVSSHNVEFGYELVAVLPYAYYLHERGLLTGTSSGVDTDCLYYFSPNHHSNSRPRSWNNMPKAKTIPNIRIHRPVLDKRFSPPPLKERYRNDRFIYDKPILCICNRINKEWNKGVINYFDLPCLTTLFKMLQNDYHIVYFNIRGKQKYYDGPEQIDISDYELARKMGITSIHDLHEENPDLTFNELQLMVMANSESFITMNGGYSILAAYMGGTNIIYSKECQELKPEVNSFYSWYNRFGGSRIIHTDDYDKLHERVKTVFVDKIPLANVIMRACQRPNFFASAYRSVIGQSYSNVNLVVGHHDGVTQKYLVPYKIYPVMYQPYHEAIDRKDGPDYGRAFPSNYYMNALFKEAKDGWIICLDDDDTFAHSGSIEQIMEHVTSEDDLLLWRINIGGRIIPSDENFGNKPVARDISGIAFCCHTKHLRDYVSEPYKLWDYRIISYLYERLNPVWINKTLTACQGQQGGGYRRDK